MELAIVKKMRLRLEKLSVENYRMAAEIQALEQTILELKGKEEVPEDYQCRSCEIEAKKHCDECGGYGSESEEEEEEELFQCDCGENIKDENRCDDCGFCCDPEAFHRCCECEDDVCCVGCNKILCKYDEEPPHKDSRDEAVCEDCWSECGNDVVLELFGEWKKEGNN
jgi:hypothetical protein